MEPALGFGEALVLAQMRRDCERDVVEQLPVIVRVRAAFAEIDLLGEGVDFDQIAGLQRVEVVEELGRQALLKIRVEHSRKGILIELLDQLADERVEEVLERVRELHLLFVSYPSGSRYDRSLVRVEPYLLYG